MAQDITVRRARSSDALRIADVFLAARRGALPYLREVHSDDETRGWIAATVFETCDLWVGLWDGAVAGFLALDDQTLEHLYVLPDYQSAGVGSALLSKAKDLSRGTLTLWTFQRNAGARRFYENRHFRAVEFTDGSGNEEAEPDVRYEWQSSVERRRTNAV